MKKFQVAMAVLVSAGLLSAVAMLANPTSNVGAGTGGPSYSVSDASPPTRGAARQIMYE